MEAARAAAFEQAGGRLNREERERERERRRERSREERTGERERGVRVATGAVESLKGAKVKNPRPCGRVATCTKGGNLLSPSEAKTSSMMQRNERLLCNWI